MGYREMALDAGYRDADVDMVAQQLEEADRLEYERDLWRKYEDEQWLLFLQEQEYKEYMAEQEHGD